MAIVPRKPDSLALLDSIRKPGLRLPAPGSASGPAGEDGSDGRSAGILYLFSTDVTNSDPGVGKLKLNNASADEATIIRMSETDSDGANQAPYINTWDDSTNAVKGVLIIRSTVNPTRFIIKQVTAQADAGTYRNVTVEAANDVINGALENNEPVVVNFLRTGNDGAEGKEGTAGKEGAEGKEGPAGSATMNGWKEPVRVATTGNIAIATALNPGDTIDGVVLAENDRVLVWQQTTTKENGIWIVKAVPVRATDADAAGELRGGTKVGVEAGTQAGRTYVIDTAGSITPGTTSHVWRLDAPRLVAFGRVSSAGAKTMGEGFTVAKTGVGTYKITFTIKAPVTPAVYVTPDSSSAIVAWTAKNTTTESTEISIWNESGLVALDYPFSFRVEC